MRGCPAILHIYYVIVLNYRIENKTKSRSHESTTCDEGNLIEEMQNSKTLYKICKHSISTILQLYKYIEKRHREH